MSATQESQFREIHSQSFDVADLYKVFDRATIDRIRIEQGGSLYAKYLDRIEVHFAKHAQHAKALGLDNQPKLRILHIGSELGYFPRICKQLGHDAIGMEVARPALKELNEWVGARVIWNQVRAKAKLPSFDHWFDLVTAFHVQFNEVKGRDGAVRLYNLDEWNFFLDDLRDNVLTRGGRLHMRMNKKYQHPGPTLDQGGLRELFESRGAAIDTSYVDFPSVL
jgi:hypothetical protein